MPTPYFDVIICGGGLVGASLALALRSSGLGVAIVEPRRPAPVPSGESWDSRVYAISPGNAAFLADCGIWPQVPQERVARVEAMEVFGDDFASRAEFSAYDAGLRELASIVENRLLQDSAWQCLENSEHVRLFCPARGTRLAWHDDHVRLQLEDGAELTARLIVGADGTDSWVRMESGIRVRPRDYGQLGVVANFTVARPHRGVAYQWFRRDGVLALLPLPGQRVSMVWSLVEPRARDLLALGPEELADQVRAGSGNALGELELITPPAAFPLRLQHVDQMIKNRLALVGDAAHNLHPLAGQGVNLGFRDARELAQVLIDRGAQADCGDY